MDTVDTETEAFRAGDRRLGGEIHDGELNAYSIWCSETIADVVSEEES